MSKIFWVHYQGNIYNGRQFLSWPMRRNRFFRNWHQMAVPEGWRTCKPFYGTLGFEHKAYSPFNRIRE